MKAINYVVTRNGRGYVQTALVPANHSESVRVSGLGLGITVAILALTAGFIGFLALSLSH